MAKSNDEFVQQVRSAVDIVDIIGEYVQLKKSGRALVGLCPFHSEKSPSFNVNGGRQFFHCFGCGAGGDVFSFVMQIEGLTFPEALKKLAERVGLTMPYEQAESPMEQDSKAAMYEAHRLVAKLYHHVLTSTPYGQAALRYVEKRGLSRQIIDEFQIGFAPDSWDFTTHFLKKRGFEPREMVEAGLLAQNDNGKIFDRFRGRIMFPIQDSQGEIIGFGGRATENIQPKYLNSPETSLFNKSRTVFNLHRARTHIRKRNQAILFEGYMDVISTWQAGIKNGIATLGTAFTEQHARVIRRNAEQVILCYDGDSAGQEATAKALEILQQAGCTVRIAPLPQGIDPDDFIKKYGADAFSQKVILQAMPVTQFRLKHLRGKRVLHDKHDEAKYIQEALEIITQLSSPIERDMYERQLADEFTVPLETIKAEARQVHKNKQKINEQRDKVEPVWNNSINNGKFVGARNSPPVTAHAKAERMLLHYMMKSQDVADRVREECKVDFQQDEHNALAAYLYAFYAEGNPEDPGDFIRYLDDENLKQLASGLAMMECNEDVSDKEISDYIRQVNIYPLQSFELERLREEYNFLMTQRGECEEEERRKQLMDQARLVGMKIHELENALKEG
ncbi:DNA primase [Brevibacillus fluminis]|uniref:DNA primase n=1 Tax=Brevibacillus fluminis TaxID=511487 RepID=UPI003F891D60